MTSLVSPSTLARLEQLQLDSRERLIGRFAGEHDSVRFGDSVDFADFREYHPGDDFRRIDYHVLARLDVLLVKLFEADDSITVRLLVDSSASMATGKKLVQAKRLAAMIGFIGLINHDNVVLHHLPDLRAPRRFSGRSSFELLTQHLEALEPAGPTPFGAAAAAVLGRGGLRGITVVISDLLTSDWEALVQLRADRSALVVLQVLDRSDRFVTFEGDLDLVDRETGERMPMSMSEGLPRTYETDVSEFLAEVSSRCRSIGAAHLFFDADHDAEQMMLATLRQQEVIR